MEIKAQRTIIMDDIEFVEFFIKGQSFLYNQIRKMIGMIIHVIRKNLPTEVIQNSFKENLFITPLAPGDGLMLGKVCYDRYNKVKMKDTDCVELPETDEGLIEDFKLVLLKYISQDELKDNIFINWLKKLDESGEGDTEEYMGEYRKYNQFDR